MNIEKLKVILSKNLEQIANLENILEETNINIKKPDPQFLNEMYNNLKDLTQHDRNKFIREISKLDGVNDDNKKFGTMREEQRKFLLEKLKERYIENQAELEKLEEVI